jgi:hypothetical protein
LRLENLLTGGGIGGEGGGSGSGKQQAGSHGALRGPLRAAGPPPFLDHHSHDALTFFIAIMTV